MCPGLSCGVESYYRIHYEGWTPAQAREGMYSYGYNPNTRNASGLDRLATAQ
jgi:hypothetical protein